MQSAACRKKFAAAVLAAVLVLSTVVYMGSALWHVGDGVTEPAEQIAYLIAYILTDLCLIAAIGELRADKEQLLSLRLTFVCMVLRLAYDALTVLWDGTYLSGLFQMEVFLLLDVGVLAGIVLLLKTRNRAVNLLLLAFTAVYVFGEAAGYPLGTFDDWDELVLMLSLLAVLAVPLLPSTKRAL